MFRFLLACVLGCVIFGLAAWKFGFISPGEANTTTATASHKSPALNLGGDLYPAQPFPTSTVKVPERRMDPVVIPGTMAVIDRPEIAAQIAGQLMFIGEEVPEGAMQVAGAATFLAEPFSLARVNHGNREVIKPYRRLEEGQVVYEDQILAMVDTAKALGDIDMKRGKVISAKADADGAKSIAEEAESKLRTAEELYAKRAIALEELRSARLTRDKMWYDSQAKIEAWKLAQIEENVSRIVYKQHEIRNKIPSKQAFIQKIFKQRGGEAVKDLEPVMQLYSLDPLKAEAQIDAQYDSRVHKGMLVTIEPSLVDPPQMTYYGHVSTVNCLAVTNDPANPLIVSGGEDQRVLVWNRYQLQAVREFKHSEAVKAVACSPRGTGRNLLLTGGSLGSLRLYDLSVRDNDKALLKEIHEAGASITALAFSPDGKYFASGTDTSAITIWNTEKIEPVYTLDERHGVNDPLNGTITSLHFTPQGKLVSAGTDNAIHVWSLKEKGASLDYAPLKDRSGTVGKLDVTADGRWLLFDQGKAMQIRSVADGGMINTLQNPGGVIPFGTLAQFSPDASLLLTAGASEGRLQLWQTPTEATRGYEVRQFAPPQHADVVCAAFAPLDDYNGEGSFAVSGNKDGQIYRWPLPSRTAIEHQPIRGVRVSNISAGINPTTRQISIGFQVPNPPSPGHPKGRLEAGRPVTIVIE